MDLSDIINQLGEDREQYFNAIAPPVIQTSNFRFRNCDEMHRKLANETEETLYTRGNNPTVDILRKKIAALEHTADALIFASGSAAISAAVISHVASGDHVICIDRPYSWTRHLLTVLLPRFGVETTFVDGKDIRNFETAIRPKTRLIYLESPNTFLLELQDLEAVSRLAARQGIITLIDNSCAGPLYQNPADFGIDLVIHSASKYIGGHSDLVAGLVCGSKESIRRIHRSELMTLGAVISPWNAWLMIRSLRTLDLRMERISSNALKVAGFLAQHPGVRCLHYPFHPSHPQYSLALSQMKGGPGLMTIELNTDTMRGVKNFCDALSKFLLAVSWGGHESLVLPVYTTLKDTEDPTSDPAFRLVRLYTGLEDARILIADLEQAFEKLKH